MTDLWTRIIVVGAVVAWAYFLHFELFVMVMLAIILFEITLRDGGAT